MSPHSHAPFAPFDDLCSETAALGRRLVVWVLAIALAGFMCVALGAPRAQSGEECMYATDMAITLRALAEEGVPRERALKVIVRMYAKSMFDKWAEAIARGAYSDQREAKKYAADLLRQCQDAQGNLDGFLGVAL